MDCRSYDPSKDREAVRRIWREVGWAQEDREASVDLIVECARALVADIGGEAECVVATVPGSLRYLEEDLPCSCLTTVATSRIARKQGLAKHLTARAVAEDVADGAVVCEVVGVFEQGYYDQLGCGTGCYEHLFAFDPSRLKVSITPRLPQRITPENWAEVHAARLARLRSHGSVNVIPPAFTRGWMTYAKNGFGLGYFDSSTGQVTHHFWGGTDGQQHGPYHVQWLAFRTRSEFLELMALLKNLDDQIWLVMMREPPGIQLQDLIERPFKEIGSSEKSKFEKQVRARADWQVRICDLPKCLAQTHLRGQEVRFNLQLRDPIGDILGESEGWHGIGGDYIVTLGPSSGAEPRKDSALPTLTASVGAFTRLWLGVRSATSLSVTDALCGPQELLEELDWLLRLPDPKPDWDF